MNEQSRKTFIIYFLYDISIIKSKIVEKSDKKIVIHVSHCQWQNNVKGWTPGTCESVAHYATELLKEYYQMQNINITKREDKIT